MYRIDMSWRAVVALVVGTALWRADMLLDTYSMVVLVHEPFVCPAPPAEAQCITDSDCVGIVPAVIRL